ncbi:fibronectin type III domain-containing protein 7-like [Takifugu flavidus]|uniref:fibronectin type III domain-containing protein 7-like n=1 Tax=Takifugu flavidus TaxID=433684 RepID=UPI00254458B7|nr:fibronectin type III domain-containing protein 7-like [Takifugu flavidus]
MSKVLLYQVTVTDSDPGKAPVIRNTSATSMDISNLEPCSSYTMGVSSVNVFLVPGEPYNISYSTATINPVTSVSVDYSCSSGTVTVTWGLVFGANLYRATAVDGTDASLNCTSASTSCQISMLKCGEKYEVRVTAISDDCTSTSNTSALFETMPCAPANPQATHSCSSNVIVFSWESTNNTFYYVATAEDNIGKVTECRTTDNMCYFTNTGCGQLYKYNVYAVSHCNSEVSQPEFVRTSVSYTVEAQGNTGQTYNCTSSTNSCAVTGIPCGEHLSVWISASNDNCTTEKVLGEVAQTVPCAPTNVSVSVDCSHDSARFNWTASIGVVFYITVAEDADGNIHSCNSMGTNCLVEGLRCGQKYNASIIGTNLNCNSTASEGVTFTTGSCPPSNIEAFRDCDTNRALIVWQNHQPTGVYTTTLEEANGARLTCTSNTVNNCNITSLPCGRKYNVTVTYNDGTCSSSSTQIRMDSGRAMSANQRYRRTHMRTKPFSCDLGGQSECQILHCCGCSEGQTITCNSPSTNCTLSNLVCGRAYEILVKASDGTCISNNSAPFRQDEVPCAPANISTNLLCGTNDLVVNWSSSSVPLNYSVKCASQYNVTVTAQDGHCTSSTTHTVISTGPCDPANVTSILQCGSNMATVSWDHAAGAVGSLLAFCPEQLPDLQHQFFTVVMDTDGRCHELCSKWNCNKWAQGFMQYGYSDVHPDKSSVRRNLHSVNYCTGQRV